MSGQRSHAGHWVFLVALILAGCQRPTSDITTTNKEVVREFFAALDAQDFTASSDLLVDGFVIRLANGTDRVGRDAAFQVIRGFYSSFPDYTHSIEEMINEVTLGDHLLNTMRVVWEAGIEASYHLKRSISTDAISTVGKVDNAILD